MFGRPGYFRYADTLRHTEQLAPVFAQTPQIENIHFTSKRLGQMTRAYLNDGSANMFSFEEIIWYECQYFKRFISPIKENKS